MICVCSEGTVVIRPELIHVGIAIVKITGLALALIVERGYPQLLAVSVKFNIRQSLNGLEEIVHSGLSQHIEIEVVPVVVVFDKTVRLLVLIVKYLLLWAGIP